MLPSVPRLPAGRRGLSYGFCQGVAAGGPSFRS
jgi:hypothetical protein